MPYAPTLCCIDGHSRNLFYYYCYFPHLECEMIRALAFFFCQWQHHKCKLTTKPVAPVCLVLAGLGAGTVLSFSPCVCCCCCRRTRQTWQQADRLLACACHWLMCFVFILLPLSVQHAACALYLHFHCGSHYFPSLKLDFYSAPKHIIYIYIVS